MIWITPLKAACWRFDLRRHKETLLKDEEVEGEEMVEMVNS